MDHVVVEIDPDIEDTYFGTGTIAGGSNNNVAAVPVPIEAKLRSLGVRLLYEVCRVQKLSVQDLRTLFLLLSQASLLTLSKVCSMIPSSTICSIW